MIAFRRRWWGREWSARLDVGAAVRMRDLAGLDVMAAAVRESVREFLAGGSAEATVTIADGLYAMFQPQAEGRGFDSRRFGRQLREFSAGELRTLFFDELREFFRVPGPKRRQEGGSGRKVTTAVLWGDVYRMAGEVGVTPGLHTYGELTALYVGRSRAEWARTAALRADVQNAGMSPPNPPADPAKLDPTGGLREAGRGTGNGAEITPDNLAGMFEAMANARRG